MVEIIEAIGNMDGDTLSGIFFTIIVLILIIVNGIVDVRNNKN